LTTIRPLINQFIVPTAYRDTGIGIRGRFKLPRKMKFSYEADLVNGMHGVNDDDEPTPFSRLLGQSSAAEPGAIAFQDQNRNKAFVGRLGLSPVAGLNSARPFTTANLISSAKRRSPPPFSFRRLVQSRRVDHQRRIRALEHRRRRYCSQKSAATRCQLE
jgi:hypothetical protein